MRKLLVAMWVVVLTAGIAIASTMTQDFESASFPPNGWSVTGTYVLWSHSNSCSGYGAGIYSAKADFYNNAAGRSQDLITISLYPATATDSLKFDHAYACYSSAGGGEKDSLRVSTSTDGGASWVVLADLPGGTKGVLNTGGSTESSFIPTAAEWATKTYTLPAGTNKIRFTALSQFGNNLYIDNVKVSYPTLSHDVGITSVTAPIGLISGQVAVAPQAMVKNDGSSTENFNATCKIDIAGGTEVYNQSLAVSGLAAGASQLLTFPNFTPDSGEYYNVRAWSELAGDLFLLNDTAKGTAYSWYSANRVLAEFNTCTSCSPCVLANDSLNVVYSDLKDSMTCIRTHVWWPTNNDPYYLGRGPDTMENRARRTYYGFNVVPYMIIGGKYFPAYPYNEFRTTILSERKAPRPLAIALGGWYSPSGDSGVVTAVINATGRFPSASKAALTLRYAITEDSSFYTGTNGDPEHFQVLRDMIPDNNGIAITIDKGQTLADSQKFTIYTGGVVPYTWTEKNCRFVVYVQDDATKEVLQSQVCELLSLAPLGVNDQEFNGQGLLKTGLCLAPGHPNPCRNQVSFEFALPLPGEVTAKIYDICGRLVSTLQEGRRNAGVQQAVWDLRNDTGQAVANGIYFFRMTAGGSTATRKITVLR